MFYNMQERFSVNALTVIQEEEINAAQTDLTNSINYNSGITNLKPDSKAESINNPSAG